MDYENNVIEYGISVSNPKDTFIKKVGRYISYKRLLKNPEIVFINNESVMEKMLTHIMNNPNVGENIKKVAKKKLIEFLHTNKKNEEDEYSHECEHCTHHCEY